MKNFIEKDSPLVPLLFMGIILLVLLCGVIGLAYMGGVFTGRDEVIANDKRIVNQAHALQPH